MLQISSAEVSRSLFDGTKEFIKGSPVLQVLLLIALTIGGTLLKSYAESIRETKPYQFALIVTLVCLAGVFALFMWISEWKN